MPKDKDNSIHDHEDEGEGDYSDFEEEGDAK